LQCLEGLLFEFCEVPGGGGGLSCWKGGWQVLAVLSINCHRTIRKQDKGGGKPPSIDILSRVSGDDAKKRWEKKKLDLKRRKG